MALSAFLFGACKHGAGLPGAVKGPDMAAKKQTIEIIALACSECKRRNYTTTKNRKTTQDKLELMKYCKWDRKHTLHKETKVK
jgi:large subunit ribosomal protein L33